MRQLALVAWQGPNRNQSKKTTLFRCFGVPDSVYAPYPLPLETFSERVLYFNFEDLGHDGAETVSCLHRQNLGRQKSTSDPTRLPELPVL